MKIKHLEKATNSIYGYTFNGDEQEVKDDIGKKLISEFPQWFEDVTPAVVKEDTKKPTRKSTKKVEE
jgi:hypothetical protein